VNPKDYSIPVDPSANYQDRFLETSTDCLMDGSNAITGMRMATGAIGMRLPKARMGDIETA